jgi:cation:H+ antiporter
LLLVGVGLLIVGLVLLTAGAALLVRGASRLAFSLRISPLIIGLTVVAYGTSAPELVVSVDAALRGHTAIALGNVVGSNIFNILVILGLSAVIAPLTISSRLVRIDVPLMIGVSIVLFVMSLDGFVGRIDGALLVLGLVLYTLGTWIWQRRMWGRTPAFANAGGDDPPGPRARTLVLDVGSALLGLLILVLGARLAVAGAVDLAEALQISSLIIGLTVVSAGTSLPELATSILAALRGERELAVGNVVGSNIFNILGVQGIASLASWSGVSVDPALVHVDLPVMIAVSAACWPIFFSSYTMHRWEGLLFAGYFLAYLTYQYLQAAHREALGLFNLVMLALVLPVTIIALAFIMIRARRARGSRP